jgi:predicted acetyltransferase
MNFLPVKTQEQIKTAAGLADEIWREYYAGIVPSAQIDYMLENFQSEGAISNQIKDKNCKYYLMHDDSGKSCGYFAFIIEENKIFLSKIYVQKNSRKKGYAKSAIAFLTDTAKNLNLSYIYLTVARKNIESVEAYKKMNFTVDGKLDTDIRGGFFMNDYKMSLKVK